MKKVLVTFLTGIALVFTASSQTFAPYVNAGVGLSSDVVSYKGQVGGKSVNSRYALVAISETQPVDNLWKLGAVGYWRINGSQNVKAVDIFATGQADFELRSGHALTLTPGLATVFNISSPFKPELSIGFPFRENSTFRNRPVGVVAGVSLNYVF